MYKAIRIVAVGVLCGALLSLGAAHAAAQETEYDPEGHPRAPAPTPDGYIPADATPPINTTPPSDALPPGAPPPSAIPPPPSGPDAPAPGPYRLHGDDTPHYPTIALETSDANTTDAGVHIPSRISTRLRALDRDYTALSVGSSSGVLDGILAIVSGGVSLALGAVVGNEPPGLRTYLYVFGAGFIAHGLVDLIFTPDPVDPALIYAHMPMGSVAEVKARLRFGEQSLESLASASRLSRLLTGSLDIATGVAFIPLYLVPRDFAFADGPNVLFDVLALSGALIQVVSGVARLIIRSEAERRWSAYETLRGELRLQRRERGGVRASLGGVPLPGGGALTLSGTF